MNTAAQVSKMIHEWKTYGRSNAEIVARQADAMLGWPYVWGAAGQDCTPELRRYFMNRSAVGAGDANLIKKRCQVLNGSKPCCFGCKYYPDNAITHIQDCQGFEKELHHTVGITLKGAGATSMYNDNSNWAEKGKIENMPVGAVCCVFKHNSATDKMDHVGQHIGNGNIIHCSGEVKKGSTSEKGWTHYAIPKAMYTQKELDALKSSGKPVNWIPKAHPTLRKGSRGKDVEEMQKILLSLGYSLGPCGADGIFGEKTLAAVKLLQKYGALKMDGICGPKTWEELDRRKAALSSKA